MGHLDKAIDSTVLLLCCSLECPVETATAQECSDLLLSGWNWKIANGADIV